MLRFQKPKKQEVKVYLVRLPDGRVVARTEEELEEMKGGGKYERVSGEKTD